MNSLLERLHKIEVECAERKGAEQAIEEGYVDEFSRLKRGVALKARNIRQLIKDRDELEKAAPGTMATVEISHLIRKGVKELGEDAEAMHKLQEKEKNDYIKKNESIPEKEEQIAAREQVVDLIFSHIEEIDQLNKQRNSGSSAFAPRKEGEAYVIRELPDIDGAGFQTMRDNDKILDNILNSLPAGIKELEVMATAMTKVVKCQGDALGHLEGNVSKIDDALVSINIRLKRTLEQTRKGDQFIVDIILLCILLGLGGYIYSIVK